MALTTQRIGAALFLKSYDHDPGATTAVLLSPDGGTTPVAIDMKNYGAIGALVRPTIVGGSGITLVRLMAYSNEACTADGTAIKTSGTVAADALADNVWLEATAEEIAQIADAAGVSLRYLSVEITTSTNTDEANVTILGFQPRFPRDGLTATAIT
jgi:hypothetical protein